MRGVLTVVLLNLVATAFVFSAAAAQVDRSEVVVGEIKGIINPVMSGYVDRVISDAEKTNASAVVFYMDTPGGLSEAMRDINLRILASKVPIIIYVAPDGARAGSAGVYISYAAQLVAMAPATNIGSATPVAMDTNGGEAQMSPEMKNKVTNDAVAGIRSLAEQRGRDPDFAERAVREGANLQASEALKANVVNYVAPDLPNLLSMGSLGLLLELYNPGSIFPGVIGGICLLLAFYALGTLPLNFAGLALIGFGLLLFGLEPFLTAHGILAAGGAISFAFGSALLINASDAPFLQVSITAIVAVTALLLGFFLFLVAAVLRGRRRRVVTGREGLFGAVGTVRRELEPGKTGIVLVQGELWQAVAPDGRVGVGEKVVVQQIDGLLLTVRRATDVVPAPPRPASPAVAKSGAARA